MTDLWTPDESTLQLWPRLVPGTEILVEKRKENGNDGPIYPAVVVNSTIPAPWIEVQATWTMKTVDVGWLRFEIGDTLREFFSPCHPFNAFAVFSPQGEFRGWYANVTRPALCEERDDALLVAWPDLILDVVMLPDGTIANLDEDELAESGLPDGDPALTRQLFAARDELTCLLREGFFPTFSRHR
ncbi:MAG TPA: DUF402 domain-containing protein [Thermomicrobiales bacterium]|nr:DUF402 domain-containing protein [Thermomicrobiales bacterium]